MTTPTRLSAAYLYQHGTMISSEFIPNGPGYFGGGWKHTYQLGREIWAVEFRCDINQWDDGYFVELA